MERPAQQRPAQPSLMEPMRVAIPQQVAIGTNPCYSDLPPTKPNPLDPTWAQLPTMEVLPAAAMSEQLPTMQAPETVSETSVEADPNLLVGAQTVTAADPPVALDKFVVVPNSQEQQQQHGSVAGSVIRNPKPQEQQQGSAAAAPVAGRIHAARAGSSSQQPPHPWPAACTSRAP